ncbi:hypothetical protein TIFTF001_021179 [Ficus carica]|uniref:Uncharacterized protein n=1 Tax=Ficus carica TaxID=3494 RepID=A0AA88AYN5_FICCA|nr:hypothetical protein TIFTF001_021179 [Ficus carica]
MTIFTHWRYSKVKIHVWTAFRNAIPARVHLEHQGIVIYRLVLYNPIDTVVDVNVISDIVKDCVGPRNDTIYYTSWSAGGELEHETSLAKCVKSVSVSVSVVAAVAVAEHSRSAAEVVVVAAVVQSTSVEVVVMANYGYASCVEENAPAAVAVAGYEGGEVQIRSAFSSRELLVLGKEICDFLALQVLLEEQKWLLALQDYLKLH